MSPHALATGEDPSSEISKLKPQPREMRQNDGKRYSVYFGLAEKHLMKQNVYKKLPRQKDGPLSVENGCCALACWFGLLEIKTTIFLLCNDDRLQEIHQSRGVRLCHETP